MDLHPFEHEAAPLGVLGLKITQGGEVLAHRLCDDECRRKRTAEGVPTNGVANNRADGTKVDEQGDKDHLQDVHPVSNLSFLCPSVPSLASERL